MFKKILVANRGEIAVRIMRTCKEMQIPCVAVYSEVDRTAMHVQVADEAVFIGPPQPSESYLNIDKLFEAAKQTGADAIHPGYGFLAENPNLAKRCADEGITFIGPDPEAIKLLGNKVASRELMIKNDLPVTPGMKSASANLDDYVKQAKQIGYPVMIKAAAGGGGKGMRLVENESQLKDAFDGAQREAKTAFGDETIYMEKFIQNPRHIEFQILADHHGNVVHLFERECSIQRRHQKIIEETPSSALTPELREKMGATAVAIAKAANYTNAGTVEFIFAQDASFYFLEMNTRIQVEHPVTEMTTGTDLVKLQIQIAAGEKLPFKQEDIKQNGHSLECRVYAEDAENNFLPSSGDILFMKEPSGSFIRNDCGAYSGVNVSVFYDPIISKLITWGEDREQSRLRMIEALKEYVILGIQTPIEYLIDILKHPAFKEGQTFTNFIQQYMDGWKPAGATFSEDTQLAMIAAALVQMNKKAPAVLGAGQASMPAPWQTFGRWESV